MTSRAATLVLTGQQVQRLEPEELGRLLRRARDIGVDEVIVEVDEVPAALADACISLGLALLIGVTCFHEHGFVTLADHPKLHPVTPDGQLRQRIEWYVGLVPTVPWVRREIAERAERLASHPAVGGVVLDFIRWPLHWELECRPEGQRTPPTSFDRVTLAAFAASRGRPLEVDPASPIGVAADQSAQWHAFRCEAITSLVTEVCERVHLLGGTVGAFVVPLPELERVELAGQHVSAWPVDTTYPMTYHAILQRPPTWVAEAVKELKRGTNAPVVPVIQITADEAASEGADWGTPFGAAELAEALTAGLQHGSRVALFPGSALIGERVTTAGVALGRAIGQGRFDPNGEHS